MTKITTDSTGAQFITTTEPGMVDAGWVWWWWKDQMWRTGIYDTKTHKVARPVVFDVVADEFQRHGLTACGRTIPYGHVVYTDAPGSDPCQTCVRIGRSMT